MGCGILGAEEEHSLSISAVYRNVPVVLQCDTQKGEHLTQLAQALLRVQK